MAEPAGVHAGAMFSPPTTPLSVRRGPKAGMEPGAGGRTGGGGEVPRAGAWGLHWVHTPDRPRGSGRWVRSVTPSALTTESQHWAEKGGHRWPSGFGAQPNLTERGAYSASILAIGWPEEIT
eukprot:6208826-Pleurochrysis_carterae.AAC.1